MTETPEVHDRQTFAEQAAAQNKGVLRDLASGEPLVPLKPTRSAEPAADEVKGELWHEPEHELALDADRVEGLDVAAGLLGGVLSSPVGVSVVEASEHDRRTSAATAALWRSERAAAKGGDLRTGGEGSLAMASTAVGRWLDAVEAVGADEAAAVAKIESDPELTEKGKAPRIARKRAEFAEQRMKASEGLATAREVLTARADKLEAEWQKAHRAPRERPEAERLTAALLEQVAVANLLNISKAGGNDEKMLALIDRVASTGDAAMTAALLRTFALAGLEVKRATVRLKQQARRLRERAVLDDPAALKVAVELSAIARVRKRIDSVAARVEKSPGELELLRQEIAKVFEGLGG